MSIFNFLKDKSNSGEQKSQISNLERKLAESRKDSDEWRHTARHWRDKYNSLINKYNQLVEEINNKGGREFLDHARIPGTQARNSVLTQSELKSLLILVHPDKHGSGRHGKMAEELFKTIHALIK